MNFFRIFKMKHVSMKALEKITIKVPNYLLSEQLEY